MTCQKHGGGSGSTLCRECDLELIEKKDGGEPTPMTEFCGCGREARYYTPSGVACNKFFRCIKKRTILIAPPHTAAWLVLSKTGMVRACWTRKPTDEQRAIAEQDGDTIIPLMSVEAAERELALTTRQLERAQTAEADCAALLLRAEKAERELAAAKAAERERCKKACQKVLHEFMRLRDKYESKDTSQMYEYKAGAALDCVHAIRDLKDE